ncbi:MAG: hypothetical protein WBE76_03210 [Terracidiphilus sp.]
MQIPFDLLEVPPQDAVSESMTTLYQCIISALMKNGRLMDRSGHVLIVAELAREFDVLDIDGRRPAPLTIETA